jgi:crossover junction endodeoxyribonuclease RuvC
MQAFQTNRSGDMTMPTKAWPDNLQTILSLDLGTRAGWAMRHKNNQITSGTVPFQLHKSEGWGKRYSRFALWLDELLKCTGRIDAVYFESARYHIGGNAPLVYGGFLARLSSWCEDHDIPYLGVNVTTIKHFISGKGNANKEDVIGSVKALGHNPLDDNEADALALLYFAMKQYDRGVPVGHNRTS